jgi:hypothetical protein
VGKKFIKNILHKKNYILLLKKLFGGCLTFGSICIHLFNLEIKEEIMIFNPKYSSLIIALGIILFTTPGAQSKINERELSQTDMNPLISLRRVAKSS